MEGEHNYSVNVTNDGASLVASEKGQGGQKVFGIEMGKTSGTWDFIQYQEMSTHVKFKVEATDGDGDTASTTVSIYPLGMTDPDAPVPEVSIDIDVSEMSKEGNDINDLGIGKPSWGWSGSTSWDWSGPKDFNFGDEYAGRTVTLSWNQETEGGWESGQGKAADKLWLLVNSDHHTEIDHQKESFSIDLPLNRDGKVTVEFKAGTTDPKESIDITDIQVALLPVYELSLTGTIDEGGEIASYLVSVAEGSLLQEGEALTADQKGQYELDADQIDGLTIIPNGDASDVTVTAIAVSDSGKESQPETHSLDEMQAASLSSFAMMDSAEAVDTDESIENNETFSMPASGDEEAYSVSSALPKQEVDESATPVTEQPTFDASGFTLADDELSFGADNESDTKQYDSGIASEEQAEEPRLDPDSALKENEVLLIDEEESLDSWLPSSESSNEDVKSTPTSSESQEAAESESSVGHIDYVKLHDDHASNNSEI